MGNAIACATEIKEKSLRICKRDWKFMKADWEWVTRNTELHDPYEGGLDGEDPNMASLFVPYGTCNECSTALLPYLPNTDEMNELREAIRKRVLRALQGNLWKQFRDGLIERRSLKLLSAAADHASDIPHMYLTSEGINAKLMKVSRFSRWSITALGWNLYIQFPWNKLDFGVSVFAILEGILDIILLKYPSKHSYASHLRILIVLRFGKYFYFVIIVIYKILSVIRNRASSELYYAYDTGRAFLFASEAVLQNIDMIVDYGPCAQMPVFICEINIKEMLHILDEFEKNYPAVVLALKSNRAARRILNRAQVVLDALKNKSLILPNDAIEIKRILFKMTKNVAYADKARTFIQNVHELLEEVDWIKPELAQDIYENHVVVIFDKGEIIQKAGTVHEFVYIIANGLVKIIHESADSVQFSHNLQSEHFHSYLTTSQTIGLLAYLKKVPSITSAICEKRCVLLRIDISLLDAAKEKFDDLVFWMWKSISINIAVELLRNEQRYKIDTYENLKLHMHEAIIPDLTNRTYLIVPFKVEDMVLIQGKVKDVVNSVEFVAPSYIPRTSRQLKLLNDASAGPPTILLMLLKAEYYHLHTFTNFVTLEEIDSICPLN